MAKILPTRRKKTPEQSVNQKVSISTGVCDNETNLEYTLSGNKNEWQCISRDFFLYQNDISVQEHRFDSISSASDHKISAKWGSIYKKTKIKISFNSKYV